MDECGSRINFAPIVWAPATAMIVVCSLLNLAAFSYGMSLAGNRFPGILLFAVGLGVLAGQIGGLSLVLVWGNGPFRARLALACTVGCWLFGCWHVGMRVAFDDSIVREFALFRARQMLAGLPLVSLAVQLPHWTLRTYFGWRFDPPEQSSRAPRRVPLSIRDVLLGTTVVGLTLCAAQFVARDRSEISPDVWGQWAIAVSVVAALSLVFLVPLVLLRAMHAGWTVGFILLAPLMSLLLLTVVNRATNVLGGNPDFDELSLPYLACVSCLATCSAPMWMARAARYRLKIGRAS